MGVAGLNINVLQTQHLDAIRTMQPACNFLLNPKGEESNKVRAAHPSALLIGRPHIDDSEVHSWYLNGDPTQAGNRAAAICLDYHHANPAVDAWVLLNEPPVDSIEQIARLAAFDMAFARAMWNGGSRGCIGAFARGTPQIPSIDGGAALRAYMPALRVAEDIGALVAIHQYGFESLFREAEWNALRWQIHILPWLASQGLRRFEYVITETGCDLGTGRMEDGQVADGWKHAFGDTQPGREDYAGQLLALMNQYAKDYRCKGATIFCAGNQSRWGSFDVTGAMLERLSFVQWPPIATAPIIPPVIPPKPVEPPTEGSKVTVKQFITHTSKHSSSREGRGIQYLVLHTTESPVKPRVSTQQNTLDYLMENALRVSINDYLAKFPDSSIRLYNMVPYSRAAHHAGADTSRLPNGFMGSEVNLRTIGLEVYRRVDQPVSSDVWEAAIDWAVARCQQFNLQASQILSHAQVDPTRRSDPVGLNMVWFRDKVAERLGALVQAPNPPAAPARLPLPEDEATNDLSTFLQKATYWAEEQERQYVKREFARASAIRISLAKLLARGRDKWSA